MKLKNCFQHLKSFITIVIKLFKEFRNYKNQDLLKYFMRLHMPLQTLGQSPQA